MKSTIQMLAICVIIALTSGCGIEVSTRGLQFEPSDPGEGDIVGPVEAEWSCATFYHCFLEDGGVGTEQECLGLIADASEKALAQKLLACREDHCGGFQSKPDGLVTCLVNDCTPQLTNCTVHDGQDSCHAYALNWWTLLEGQSYCETEPSALCQLEFMHRLAPEAVDVVSGNLLDCFGLVLAHWQIWSLDEGNEQKKEQYWDQFWGICLPLCP